MNVKERGCELVKNNSKQLCTSFRKVFDTDLAKQIDVSKWTIYDGDHSEEAVKLLYYLFKKIDFIESCNNKNTLNKYYRVVDNVVTLMSVIIRETVITPNIFQILNELLELLCYVSEIVEDRLQNQEQKKRVDYDTNVRRMDISHDNLNTETLVLLTRVMNNISDKVDKLEDKEQPIQSRNSCIKSNSETNNNRCVNTNVVSSKSKIRLWD